MPSPKSPSQRGLEGRLARLVASMIPGTHGGRVLNASPVSPAQVTPSRPALPVPAAGAGALLGWAALQFIFPAVTPNASTVHATSSGLVDSWGSHGITVDGVGGWTIDDDNIDCLYVATIATREDITYTGFASTDVTELFITTALVTGSNTVVAGRVDFYGGGAETSRHTAAYTYTPTVQAVCSGGSAGRSLEASAYVTVARWAA